MTNTFRSPYLLGIAFFILFYSTTSTILYFQQAAIGAFVAVQVARRVSNFALARPAREVLFTAVPQEDRYKTKNFIDTVVYRCGDQSAGWAYAGLLALGLSITGIALVAIPLSALWLALSYWLGRRQEALERGQTAEMALPPVNRD